MNKPGHKPNVAMCIGDLQAAKSLLRGLANTLKENGINLHIFNGCSAYYEDNPQNVGQLNIYNLPNYDMFDVLVIAPFFLSTDDGVIRRIIERALNKNVSVITIGKRYEYNNCYCVMPDCRTLVRSITDHIIELHGAKRLNFLAGIKGDEVSEERLAGFKDSLEKHGISFDRTRIYYGDFWEQPAIKQVEKMEKDGRLDCEAIICANDSMALAVMIKLLEMGYEIPAQIKVTGLDGIDEANGFITTAKLYEETTGKMAADIVCDFLKNGKKPQKLAIVPPYISYGFSCACRVQKHNAHSVKLRHNMFSEIDDTKKYTTYATSIMRGMANCKTFEEASEFIYEAVSKLWCNNAWVCICDDFMAETVSSTIDGLNADAPLHRHGYPEIMKCIVSYIKNKEQPICVFRSEEMLPDFYANSDLSSILMYTPINSRDNTLGYLVYDYSPEKNNLYLLNTIQLMDFIAINTAQLLEMVRNQNALYLYAQKVDELLIKDPLTGLYNRRGFFREYNRYINKGESVECMVVSVDLDNLKQINDVYGHNEGDCAIKRMADILSQAADECDVCARFGGDEYVVLGFNKNEEKMQGYIDSINKALEAYNNTSDKPYKIMASVGGCIMPNRNALLIDYYINAADSKMYSQKQSHKNARTRLLRDIT